MFPIDTLVQVCTDQTATIQQASVTVTYSAYLKHRNNLKDFRGFIIYQESDLVYPSLVFTSKCLDGQEKIELGPEQYLVAFMIGFLKHLLPAINVKKNRNITLHIL